jgi:hypothetical protein
MLRLTFTSLDGRQKLSVSSPAFLLTATLLHSAPQGELIGEQCDFHWRVDGRDFIRFECEGNVICEYEVEGAVVETHEPEDKVAAVDGVLWMGEISVAQLQGRHWLSNFTGKTLDRIRLRSVPG